MSVTEKIVINGKQVKLYDRYPNLTFNGMCHLQQINSDKQADYQKSPIVCKQYGDPEAPDEQQHKAIIINQIWVNP